MLGRLCGTFQEIRCKGNYLVVMRTGSYLMPRCLQLFVEEFTRPRQGQRNLRRPFCLVNLVTLEVAGDAQPDVDYYYVSSCEHGLLLWFEHWDRFDIQCRRASLTSTPLTKLPKLKVADWGTCVQPKLLLRFISCLQRLKLLLFIVSLRKLQKILFAHYINGR